jgi:hypothetical protein
MRPPPPLAAERTTPQDRHGNKGPARLMRPTINSSTSCAVQGSGTYTSSGSVNRLVVTMSTSNPEAPGNKFAPPMPNPIPATRRSLARARCSEATRRSARANEEHTPHPPTPLSPRMSARIGGLNDATSLLRVAAREEPRRAHYSRRSQRPHRSEATCTHTDTHR